jgi:hypothetical protein
LAGHRTDWADSSSVRRGPSVVSTFRSLPWPIQLAAVCLVAALGITLVVMALEPWNDRSRRTDARARHRAKAERRELRKARPEPDPSATPHDPHVARMDTHVRDADMTQTADQPELRVASERKLPGQDRLTRNPRTGMDVVPAAADDHLSGPTSPSQRLDPPLAAEQPPPLRSGDPSLAPQGGPGPVHPAPGARPPDVALPGHPPTTQMPMAMPFPPPPAQETRAQRRQRLEALIQRDAERRPPESP